MSFPRFHFQDAPGRMTSATQDKALHVTVNYHNATHDQGELRAEPADYEEGDYENECEAQGRDAGRQRFARSPQSNHMQGGGWNDEDFDLRNQRTTLPNARPP